MFKSNRKQRAPTRLDEISKDDAELRRRLKNFDRIMDDELESIPIGTFVRYLRFKDGEWKFRTGGILSYNGYPDYWCIKFRMRNGKWKPHNINLSKDFIFFHQKKSKYCDEEIKGLTQALESGYLKLIRSDDLKKLTTIYKKVQRHNGKSLVPDLLHTNDLEDDSSSEDIHTNRKVTFVELLENDDEYSDEFYESE